MSRGKILLTGGAGYIGSHTYISLVQAGYDVVIYDNFSNAKSDVPSRLAQITGKEAVVYKGDVLDLSRLSEVFDAHDFDAVIHFAALKAVGESVEKPLEYFETNISGLLNLLKVMKQNNVCKLVFSSSATVYGTPEVLPIPESSPLGYQNPYGYTKVAGEQILEQVGASDPFWAFAVLRYFNPVGAHHSGVIGEDPMDIPNNLMPYIAKVAAGELPALNVYGGDYPTPDGTGVRDYIHVVDLALGHVMALDKALSDGESFTVNLGRGEGYSVLEMFNAYKDVSGQPMRYEIAPRRAGDIASYYSSNELAKTLLGFEAQYGLRDMCETSWKWISSANVKKNAK